MITIRDRPRSASRYATSYATKCQNTFDNIAMVELAMQRHLQTKPCFTMPLAYAACSTIGIGGPLATVIFLEVGEDWFSCKSEYLVLLAVLNVMEGSTSTRRPLIGHFAMQSSPQGYTTHPQCMDKCCQYEFCAWFKSNWSKPAIPEHACSLATDDTRMLARHMRSHGLVLRYT